MTVGVKKKKKKRQSSRDRKAAHNDADGEVTVGFLHAESSSDSEFEHWKKSPRRKESNGCSRTERQISVLLAVCLVVITVMAVLLVVQHMEYENKPEVCLTPDCVAASGSLLQYMDLTADPCSDFYQYTCGRWLENTMVPPSRAKWGAFSRVYQRNQGKLKRLLETPGSLYRGANSSAIAKVKAYFKECMDTASTDKRGNLPLLQLIQGVGSWPLLSDSISGTWDPSTWDTISTLVKIHRRKSFPLFRMSVSQDDKNSSANIISFEQSGLLLGQPELYKGNASVRLQDVYVRYFSRIIELLGGNSSQSVAPIQQVWQLEVQLAEAFVPKSELQDQRKIYHKMTVSELQKLVGSSFDLSKYLSGMFEMMLPLNEDVLVYMPDYIVKMSRIVSQTDKSVLANYLVWHAVESMVPYMSTVFKEASLILLSATKGISSLSQQWELCVTRADDAFGYATGALYVQENFHANDVKNTKDIIHYIRETFIANLPRVEWMDSETKKLAIDKANAVAERIGFPDFILQPDKLDKYYENLTVSGNMFEDVLKAKEFYEKKFLDRRGKPPDKSVWDMTPAEVNAYYNPSNNYIAFPAGILQKPFYSAEFPMSVNFGAVGMVMGHELTHGFDNTGRLYDKFGNMHDWWKNESEWGFNQRTRCMMDQYSKYQVEDVHVNGLTTLGENIADNGGVKTSFDAYHSWLKEHNIQERMLPGMNLTSDQLFFVGFGQIWCAYYTPAYARKSVFSDVHSPANYRVIGVVSNSEEFTKAYNCPASSPMNPAHKCKVW